MQFSSPYVGARVALATRHGKERVIGRALRSGLGAELLHLPAIDTDAFGSFCGSTLRQGSAREACIAKARAALEHGGTALAIASEGSFGPHPSVPLLPVGLECMAFLDEHRGFTLVEELLAPRTNFAQLQLSPEMLNQGLGASGLTAWLAQLGFPRHGLIVRSIASSQPAADGLPPPVAKGIRSAETLLAALVQASAQAPLGWVQLETDMRAHCNPTRMASIRRLSFRLVRRLATACPACGTPGWGRVRSLTGLPCSWCGGATGLIRAELLGCVLCDHHEQQPRRDGQQQADPSHCPFCNP